MLKNIIEGLLMASPDPLKVDELLLIVNDATTTFTADEIKQAIAELVADYQNRGIQLQEVARGYRFQVTSDLAPWLNKLYAEKPPRYSRALLESLALIAYKQPITRAEVEEIRGVSGSYNVMKTLLEHEWVKIAGYKNVPGRPALFITTNKFLDHFNLKSLTELPPLADDTLVATKVAGLVDNIAVPAESLVNDNDSNSEDTDLQQKIADEVAPEAEDK